MATRIVIVGGGLVGIMLARALQEVGDVLILDSGDPGASAATFGWINASFHHDDHHFALRHRSMARWRALADAGEVDITWGGALWWEESGAAMDRFHDRLQQLGYAADVRSGPALGRDLGALAHRPDAALWLPEEGVLETGPLLRHPPCPVLRGARVQGFETRGGRVTGVAVDGGVIAADQVVVAAGTGSAQLAGSVGLPLPMLSRPGVLFRTAPVPEIAPIGPVLVAPEMELRMDRSGRLVAPASASHQSDETETLPQTPLALAEAALGRMEALMGRPLQLQRTHLAQRPVPGDGLPVVGEAGAEGLFWAVMHSGVTLAAAVAELLVAEMRGKDESAWLAPYRPGRFSS